MRRTMGALRVFAWILLTVLAVGGTARAEGGTVVLAGIHFEFSNRAGQESGRHLANEILTTRLQRLHPPYDWEPRCPQS